MCLLYPFKGGKIKLPSRYLFFIFVTSPPFVYYKGKGWQEAVNCNLHGLPAFCFPWLNA